MAVERLTAIGWGLTTFAIIIGIGLVVLTKLGNQIVTCANVGGGVATWNTVNQTCINASGTAGAGSGAGYGVVSYVATQMGSTGLAGWIPVVIVVLIAGLVLALFGGRGKNY